MKETILVDHQAHDVEIRPITLICHKGDVRIDAPLRVEIRPELTVARAKSLDEDEWASLAGEPAFKRVFRYVFGVEPEPALTWLQKQPLGRLHITGMMVMIAEAAANKAQFFLRYPETYLHPAQQASLGDVIIAMSMGDLGVLDKLRQ